LRHNLKLRDEDGIVSIPDTELFENLTLMGQYSRRARIAQSFALPTIADEPTSPVRDVSEVEACPTGRNINEGEAAAKRISNDLEEIARVLTSMDAATVLAGGIDVPTGSGSIPTVGPPATIARDAEVARIHAEEELQGMIDSLDKSNETIAKYLQEYQDFALELPLEKRIELISDLRLKDFKGMTFKEIEAKFAKVWKQVENFIPMGSKEETERIKRKDLLKQLDKEDLNQLWALVKEYLSIRPTTIEKEMELWVELKRMYEPDPEDQLLTLT
nr:hypothetical protein [Tanacetum cinerariifolium]